MPRSRLSLRNSEMALGPALVILVPMFLFAVCGYWLMKPTVLNNPGVAVYHPPAATKVLLDAKSEAKLLAAEAAATTAANNENRKLGLAANASVSPKSVDGGPVEGPAPPKQRSARVRKHQEAPGHAPRVAQRETAPSLFGWRFGPF
jgi:hypothetical protein